MHQVKVGLALSSSALCQPARGNASFSSRESEEYVLIYAYLNLEQLIWLRPMKMLTGL